jgi:hypothetical protein
VLWKIHNSSLLTATSPQSILAIISVSPIGRANLGASGLTARRKRQDLDDAALPVCASVSEAYAAEPPHSGEDGAAAPAEPATAGKAG